MRRNDGGYLCAVLFVQHRVVYVDIGVDIGGHGGFLFTDDSRRQSSMDKKTRRSGFFFAQA
jgi:hypothetical protein